MQLTTVKEIYRNKEQYLDKQVTVGGWVRSVRDSKTFGFIVLHDGSFFETLQVVYHDSMDNFQDISKLNVGAAIIVKGTWLPHPRQSSLLKSRRRRSRWRGFRCRLSAAEKTPLHGVSAHHFPSASENQYVPGSVPRALHDRVCCSSVLSGEGLCLCAHPIDHRQRL